MILALLNPRRRQTQSSLSDDQFSTKEVADRVKVGDINEGWGTVKVGVGRSI